MASTQASACEDPEQQKTAAVVAVVAQGVYAMNKSRHVTRRSALQLGDGSALPLVHIRSAAAAGKLTVGFWDHWVPATNDVMRKQVATWPRRPRWT